jgi:uncharacterized protein YunC (DUF1805 family)
MEKITIDGIDFSGFAVSTENAMLLAITAPHGMLACGYVKLETANKLLEHVAIVTGVKTFDDMLEAEIVGVSEQAAAIGIKRGMTGRKALLKMT